MNGECGISATHNAVSDLADPNRPLISGGQAQIASPALIAEEKPWGALPIGAENAYNSFRFGGHLEIPIEAASCALKAVGSLARAGDEAR